MEWRGFRLRRLGRAKELAGGCLIKARTAIKPAHRFEHARSAQTRHVTGIFWHIKRNTHMALGCQVVNLIRFGVVDHVSKAAGGAHISVMQEQPRCTVDDMRILIQVVNAFCIESTRPADDAMDLVTFVQEEFSQVRSILTGNASNYRFFHVLPQSHIEGVVYLTRVNTAGIRFFPPRIQPHPKHGSSAQNS